MKVKTVLFFHNGNTAVFDRHGEQIPELQKSWFLMFVRFLKENGIDPLGLEFRLPNNSTAELFEIPDGYNWSIK